MILEIDTKEPIGPVEAEILAALLAGAGWVHATRDEHDEPITSPDAPGRDAAPPW